jgi:hypothetical protein
MSAVIILEFADATAEHYFASFMDRLGPALGEAGVRQPTRVQW